MSNRITQLTLQTLEINNLTFPLKPDSKHVLQTALKLKSNHLLWIAQKFLLKQDIFLLSSPSPFPLQLILSFLLLSNLPCEYISITKDNTDSDLKQRRDIVDGSAIYSNQVAVRAAIHGRVLILDGIEKAERFLELIKKRFTSTKQSS